MISKIRNLEFALYWSTALLTTLSLYALSYWFSSIAPPPTAEYMHEMEICHRKSNQRRHGMPL
jgi:hypothetical protein